MQEVIEEVLFTEEEIAARVKELGARITKDYEGKELIRGRRFKRVADVHGGPDPGDKSTPAL